MTEQDYELLSQYLDGELPVEQAQELRKRLLAEPPLQAVYERLKKLNNRVKSAFNVPGADTVPAHVVKMVHDAETLFGQRFSQHACRLGYGCRSLGTCCRWCAFEQRNTGQSGEDTAAILPVRMRCCHRCWSSRFPRVDVWTSLSNGSSVRPLLSFSSVQGGWCREYLLSDGDSKWRGVACRSGGQWLTAVLAAEESSRGTVSDYRPAGASTPDQIASFIDKQSADIPLSQEQEAGTSQRVAVNPA